MSFKIIGDSCTDPVPGLKDAPEYAMVPLIIRIGNQEYVDNGMLTTEDWWPAWLLRRKEPVRHAPRPSGIWMPLKVQTKCMSLRCRRN